MLLEEETKKPKWSIESLRPVPMPDGFWKPCPEDVYPCVMMLVQTIFIWIVAALSFGFLTPLQYWDGPNYLYAAMTLYNIPEKNPWTQYLSYPRSYFACHLPGFPLMIRVVATLLFNSFILADIISIIGIPVLLVYVFRRVLTIYKCVDDPQWTATLLAFLPIRFIIYHSTGASEPTFMLFAFMAFIFFKTEQVFKLCMCICMCCITRIEGLVIWGTFGLCYLLRFDIKRATCVGLCLGSFGMIVLFHQYRFGEWNAYLKFNQGNQRIIAPYFLYELSYSSRSGFFFGQFQSVIGLFVPFFLSVGMCYTQCLPFAILGTAYFIFVTRINHLDIFRYALPGYIPCLLIGLDSFFSDPSFKKVSIVVFPCLIFLGTMYAANQINSNRAPDFFFDDVLKAPIHYI